MAEIALFSRRLAGWSGAPPRWYPLQLVGGVNMMPTAELLVVETTRSAACPKQLSTKRNGIPHFHNSGQIGIQFRENPRRNAAAGTVIAHCPRQARLLRFLVGVPGWEKRRIVQSLGVGSDSRLQWKRTLLGDSWRHGRRAAPRFCESP